MSEDNMGDDKDIYMHLGSLTASVSGLKDSVEGFAAKSDRSQTQTDKRFTKIQEQLVALNGNTVKQPQCEARAKAYSSGLKEAVVELKTAIAKKQTKDDWPAVGTPHPDHTGSIRVPLPATEAEATSWVKKLKDRIGLVIAICTLLGILVVGVIKVSKFVVSMEGMLKRQEKAYKHQRVIHIYHADGGVEGTPKGR